MPLIVDASVFQARLRRKPSLRLLQVRHVLAVYGAGKEKGIVLLTKKAPERFLCRRGQGSEPGSRTVSGKAS